MSTASEIRRIVRREVEKTKCVMLAIQHIKSALDNINNLPERARDSDAHDVTVMTAHGHVMKAANFFEQFWRQGGGERSLRTNGNGNGDDLGSAINHIRSAGDEAGHWPDTDGDEERLCIGAMHSHCAGADSAFERYRSLTEDPQAEAAAARRRDIARGWAGAFTAGYGGEH